MNKRAILTLGVLSFGFMAAVSCKSKEQAAKEAAEGPTPADLVAGLPKPGTKLIEHVEVTTPLNQEWVAAGKEVYDMKCLACHRLDETRIVGPGWKGITERRTPEWIMNMTLNVDVMLETDEEAQKLLEQCLVRMPDQNLTYDEGRQVFEFMRDNDGVE